MNHLALVCFDYLRLDHKKTICNCKGKIICKTCWNILISEVIKLEEILIENFGFEDIKWLFSGRRGIHLYVLKEECKFYSSETRKSIIDYCSSKVKIDRPVTIDLNRLMRLPNSIHGATGNICRIINKNTSLSELVVNK